MKIFTVLISILLLTYINTDDTTCNGTKGKKADDCKDLKKTNDEDYCCYIKGKNKQGDSEGCIQVSKADYDNIKNYIQRMEELGKNDDVKVKKLDCYSFYLTGSLFSLVLFFL